MSTTEKPMRAFCWPQLAAIALLVVVGMFVPRLFGDFIVNQLTFVCIYAIAGIGLQLLSGFTGQISIGHAAFMAIGAYGCVYLETLGLSFLPAAFAALIVATLVGIIIARPASRMTDVYLLTATIAFGFIVEEVVARWTAVTGGNGGQLVGALKLFGWQISRPSELYMLAVVLAGMSFWIAVNVLNGPLGRAMMAVRDSEIAAQSMGVDAGRTKTIAFALSAAFCALAGSVYAHVIGYISPDQFTIMLSLDLTVMLLIGGANSLLGVLFGAVFLVMLPEALRFAFGWFSGGTGEIAGVRPIVEGIILIAIMRFEPWGLAALYHRAVAALRRSRATAKAAVQP